MGEIRIAIADESAAFRAAAADYVARLPGCVVAGTVEHASQALALVRTTRPSPNGDSPDFVKKWVNFGASVRAAQYLTLGAKARALMDGRPHVQFEDVRALAKPVLRHRILTNFHAESERVTTDSIIDQLLQHVPVPKSGM